jgi:hypothetical protein
MDHQYSNPGSADECPHPMKISHMEGRVLFANRSLPDSKPDKVKMILLALDR